MTTHTKGPWTAYGSEKTTHTGVKGADGKAICHMVAGEHDWNNARLIAAAPDLLEALEQGRKENDMKLTCLRCQHQWHARTEHPVQCPYCKSVKWKEPRKKRR